jgi:MinD superfamily P-loop ATPase
MTEITVISGKGGTGKTSLAAALATAGSDMVLCDGDVDAADLHLVLQPEIRESRIYESSWQASIDPEQCTNCGICSEYCRFDAIRIREDGVHHIDPYRCEGCRLCERICPSGAISSMRRKNNAWFVSDTRAGTMVHARMGPGEENSGKLVTLVRNKARELAGCQHSGYVLTDGPPGTGCPAIAALTGADRALLVMEPSLTSLHDADRVIELARKLSIPVFAVINKHDIHPETAGKIEKYLENQSVPLIGKIPFSTQVIDAMVAGQTMVEYDPGSEIAASIRRIWEEISREELPPGI